MIWSIPPWLRPLEMKLNNHLFIVLFILFSVVVPCVTRLIRMSLPLGYFASCKFNQCQIFYEKFRCFLSPELNFCNLGLEQRPLVPIRPRLYFLGFYWTHILKPYVEPGAFHLSCPKFGPNKLYDKNLVCTDIQSFYANLIYIFFC